ncbi:MAG: hypothetical protein UY63_C0006G0037 [Parcubacteria group bacterium GW2011_GWA2_51_10]|nr:MAG: hypothetical protein UY63_C0006G0037 [Parcubacteria group bacterium GW2011_GWA2_51_10]
MARKKPLTKEEKRLKALAAKTEDQKRALVAQLRRTPIVQLACERTGVGRSTYYQWRARDKIFARAAERALKAGQFLINDMAESRLMRMIQDDNLTAIIFWLKHNHPKYAVTTRVIHEYEVATEHPSLEEMNRSIGVVNKMIANSMAKKIAPRLLPDLTVDELREQIEKELEDAERDAPDRKRMEEFGEDREEPKLPT